MRNIMQAAIAAMALAALPQAASASPMVYTPVNPDFGGSSFNGATLLNEANAQNNHDAPQPKTSGNTQQSFANTITSALLGEISTNIGASIYGPNAKNSGTYLIGSTRLDFNHNGGEVNITITDLSTGQTTTVQVPSGI
jgi:curli production assembly/transport component CsgF